MSEQNNVGNGRIKGDRPGDGNSSFKGRLCRGGNVAECGSVNGAGSPGRPGSARPVFTTGNAI